MSVVSAVHHLGMPPCSEIMYKSTMKDALFAALPRALKHLCQKEHCFIIVKHTTRLLSK